MALLFSLVKLAIFFFHAQIFFFFLSQTTESTVERCDEAVMNNQISLFGHNELIVC